MDDEKIVDLTEVVKRIAALSDVDEETSREFMLAFSRVLVDALLNKESVDIKAIGRFLEDEHLSGNVKFEASLPLASAVNRPFSCFDPIELDDETEIPEEKIEQQTQKAAIVNDVENEKTDAESSSETYEKANSKESICSAEQSELTDSVQVNYTENSITEGNNELADIEPQKEDMSESAISATVVKIDDNKPLQVEIVGTEEQRKKHPLAGWIFSLGLVLGLCVGFIAGMFLHDYIYPDYERDIIADDIDLENIEVVDENPDRELTQSIVPDSAEQQNDTATVALIDDIKTSETVIERKKIDNDLIVTDTIGSGRFLATMARKHYGSFVFWVYIYEENRDKIADPDNVAIGTVVVIPDASKYGIDAMSSESIKKAKSKASEIAKERLQ
jgi:Uncharacterized protein containing LysM domain